MLDDVGVVLKIFQLLLDLLDVGLFFLNLVEELLVDNLDHVQVFFEFTGVLFVDVIAAFHVHHLLLHSGKQLLLIVLFRRGVLFLFLDKVGDLILTWLGDFLIAAKDFIEGAGQRVYSRSVGDVDLLS